MSLQSHGDEGIVPDESIPSNQLPAVSAFIEYSSVMPSQGLPCRWQNLRYRYRTEWFVCSTGFVGVESQWWAIKALGDAMLGVTLNRQRAKRHSDKNNEYWDWGWEASKWVDTLVSVAEALSARPEVKITVSDPCGQKVRGRAEFRAGPDDSADRPGQSQTDGAWASDGLINEAITGSFRKCPTRADTYIFEEIYPSPFPWEDRTGLPWAEEVHRSVLDVSHGAPQDSQTGQSSGARSNTRGGCTAS